MKGILTTALLLGACGLAAAQEEDKRRAELQEERARTEELRRQAERRAVELRERGQERPDADRARKEHHQELERRMAELRERHEQEMRKLQEDFRRRMQEHQGPEATPPKPPVPPVPPDVREREERLRLEHRRAREGQEGAPRPPQAGQGGIEEALRRLAERVERLANEVEKLKQGGDRPRLQLRVEPPAARSQRAEPRPGQPPEGGARPNIRPPMACRCEGKCETCHPRGQERGQAPGPDRPVEGRRVIELELEKKPR